MSATMLGRKKVLLSEGNRGLRQRLTRHLSGGGYEVTEAATGKATLSAIKAESPDIVLLDISMPETDGVELLREVRRTSPHVQVVVITAKSRIHDVERLADDFVVKPVDPATVEARLSWALAHPRIKAATAPLQVVLQELHDSRSGRIRADKVADYLGIPLKKLAQGLGANYVAVHKTPDAQALQERLIPIKRSLEILDQIVGEVATVRAWLNSPHPDLGQRTPMQVILEGNAGALSSLLENAAVGVLS